ncbi:Phosphate acyltransferase [Thalictrum thalictroides]|uniref:Phosphate acyltransferase n=1 Tax=Thalictrum thalictroides TaxID=46969 RepID=A0A7J6UYR7_THATH|nr:Phosphate acyltransferase [Thalictrum thalictroides]
MTSLKLEAKNLAKDLDRWFGSSKNKLRCRTRTQTIRVTSTISRKRRRRNSIVKDDDRCQKRRLFSDESDDSDVKIISSSEKTKSTNQGVDDDEGINCLCPKGSTETESDLMEDKDYMAYIAYIIETFKGDFDAMSKEGNVDCERVSTQQVDVLNGGINGNVDSSKTSSDDDDNVDCERVSTENLVDIMEDKGSSEQILYVGMNGIVHDIMEDKGSSEQILYVDTNGIVHDKITDDDNAGCENSHHTVCVHEGVSPQQVDVEDKSDMEYLEHGKTHAYSDPMSREGNLDAPLEMLSDNVGCGCQSSEEEDVDPDYKIFLDNVRQDEYSYIFERKKEDRTTVLVKYEEDNEKLIEDTTKDEGAYLDYSSSQERMKDLKDKEKSKTKVLDNDFGKTNQSPAEQPRPMTPHWFLSDCKPGTISCTDESYLKFLDHVWVEGDSLTFKYEGIIVKYGDDSRVMADPEGLHQKDAAYGNEVITSKVAMSEDDSDSVQILDSGKVNHKKEFSKLLRKAISKPFDKYEFRVSLKKAKIRKWIELDKETRRTCFSIPTKRKRKSYLGHYPDLKKLLDGALEEPFPKKRALALLRCLFFHMKHQPHPGYFVPWRYPPAWLHDRICCCQGNTRNCPIRKRRRSKIKVLNLD